MNFDHFLKERVLEDEKLSEYLTYAMADENEGQQKFSNTLKKTDVVNLTFEERLKNTKRKKRK